jgi:toxin YhaV
VNERRTRRSRQPAATVVLAPPASFRLFAHPLFLDQLRVLELEVGRLKARDPHGYLSRNATKRLAAITHLVFEVIAQDPTRPEYRQGHTLGAAHSHWFRAEFFGQYRLFFRFDLQSRVIIFAWVNDEQTLRAYGSGTDAYRVFSNMLAQGHPPDGWERLLSAAAELGAPSGEAVDPTQGHRPGR